MEGLFLGDRSVEDDDGNEFAGPQYCGQALADVSFYRLVKLTHYTPRQLEDEVSAQDAMRLLRADGAWSRAEAEDMRRKAPKGS